MEETLDKAAEQYLAELVNKGCEWDYYKDGNKKAWMLPEPYKE